jgi:hypothetical protein
MTSTLGREAAPNAGHAPSSNTPAPRSQRWRQKAPGEGAAEQGGSGGATG